MKNTVNRSDLLKEMSAYQAGQVIRKAVDLLVADGFEFYRGKRKVEIPQEYIYKVLGRRIELG
ncbi:DUF3173 family protein [Streptococcus merionis]|uniref:DUF3173 family protein n=1 Tax=Streptococcus merionis TaxID=400065 RepID=UPI0035191C4D